MEDRTPRVIGQTDISVGADWWESPYVSWNLQYGLELCMYGACKNTAFGKFRLTVFGIETEMPLCYTHRDMKTLW